MAAVLNVFGCAFDPEIGEERLAIRRRYAALAPAAAAAGVPQDPYAVLRPFLAELPDVVDVDALPVEEWARPVPAVADPRTLTAEDTLERLRAGSGRAAAAAVRAHVTGCSGIPIMLGIDHALSGGAIEALQAAHGALGVVVLDAHADLVPGEIRQGLFAYACERDGTKPDPLPPVPDYECGSFLHDLIARGIIRPDRLVVLGCAEPPPDQLRGIGDARVRRYVEHWDELRAAGLRIVHRDDLVATTDLHGLVTEALAGLRGLPVYVSCDLDVGAHTALVGCRYLDQSGLSEARMVALLDAVLDAATRNRGRLAGFDLMEFDFYRAGIIVEGRQDRTYDIALALVDRVVGRLDANQGDPACAQYCGSRSH